MRSKTTRMIILLIVLAAVLSLAACGGKTNENSQGAQASSDSQSAASEENTGSERTVDLTEAGVTFTPPESWQNDALTITATASTIDDGVTVASARMISLSDAEVSALYNAYADNTEEYNRQIALRTYQLFFVFGINGGRGEKELRAVLTDLTDADIKVTKVGSAGEWNFFSVAEKLSVQTPSQDKKEAVEKALSDVQTAIKSMQFCEPVPFEYAEIGSSAAFAAENIKGDVVFASELFAENKITAISIWSFDDNGSVQQMADYDLLYESFRDKGCGMIGIIHDYNEETSGEIAFSTAKAGISFPLLKPSHDVDVILPTNAYPTTYFVDAEGKILCGPVIGADVAGCAEVLNDLLSRVG